MEKMTRREIFERYFGQKSTNNFTSSSLDEYTQPLNRLQVRHLLHRASFSLDAKNIDKYTGKTAGFIVDELFANADKKLSPPPPFFINDRIKNPVNLTGKDKTDQEAKKSLHQGEYNEVLAEWWVTQFKNDSDSILEKMVFFWHDHFATQFAICDNIPAISMYKQNDLFRKNYAGNFRTLLERITIDGAMLRYLNGNENNSELPNENYARELMELFSLGVGNYTEQDIREAAKILTGWKVSMFDDEETPYEAYVLSHHFDKNTKLFMGETFSVNYEVNTKNVFDNSVKRLINVILTKKRNEAAVFMSKKLYEYFVYANSEKSDMAVVNQMAKVLLDNNFEFKPMLKSLLKSKHFFDDLNVGVQLKSPLETVIGFTHHFAYNHRYSKNIMRELGLWLFNPPNVAGWKGYRSWVSTKTLPSTIKYLKSILNETPGKHLGQWIININGYEDSEKLVVGVSEIFLARDIGSVRIKKLQNSLLAGAPDYEWYDIVKSPELAGQRVRVLLTEIIKAPDFYLF
jgi:uncharacterized protein (DUF1800 family)